MADNVSKFAAINQKPIVSPDEEKAAPPPQKGRIRSMPAHEVQPTGAKSTDPDFMQLKVYVRKTTKRQAARKWEDENRGDVSDLIESLLQKYLKT